ncbi:hypothetical protein [Aureibaculum luteum]|uniref:hypothetical protein n=1 Tax=Aureibaculum luteum TaxID=1548456 RepID=UPI000E4B9884|nr:hypothetical protein [Aureibaculum luteum]
MKIVFTIVFSFLFINNYGHGDQGLDPVAIEKERVLKLVDAYFDAKQIPLTDFSSKRSTGGMHNFYSEGECWLPDP